MPIIPAACPPPQLALFSQYDSILNPIRRNKSFDSHWFIQQLSRRNQDEYIRALTNYLGVRKGAFKALHGDLAKLLNLKPQIQKQLNRPKSKNNQLALRIHRGRSAHRSDT